jgi:hypothetical protein
VTNPGNTPSDEQQLSDADKVGKRRDEIRERKERERQRWPRERGGR